MISPRLTDWEISAFLIILLMGCSQPRPRIDALPLPQLSHLTVNAEANRAALQDFRGEGLVIVRGPDINAVLGINIAFLQPDFMRLSLRSHMGVHAGTLIHANGYYELTNGSSSQKTGGKLGDFSLEEDYGLPFNGSELLDLFSLLIILESIPDDAILKRDTMLQLYSISWTDEEIRHQVWMDPFQPVAKKELLLSMDGDTLWFREAKGVKKRAGVLLPMSWNVQVGGGENTYKIELKLSNLWVNRGVSPAEFEVNGFFQSDSSEARYDG